MTKRNAPRLRRGDVVGVVAPGFAVRRRRLQEGLARLRRMGFRPRVASGVLERDGYLAGSDERRLEDLRSMIEDADVRAIWFARGGYGSSRLLDRVPWAALRRDPKLLIGYSDLTAFFAAAVRHTGHSCLYGPVVSELGDSGLYHAASLRAAIGGGQVEMKLRPSQVLAPGRVRGRLAGGNLSVLTHLCGTRFFPDLRGSLLLIEETGEELYRLDRMLTQLRLAGALAQVRGVLLGDLIVPPRRRFPPDRPLGPVLDEFLLPLGVPVVRGLPVGHGRRKRTVFLGGETVVDTEARRIVFGP
jgi:muramoyltetrapeptide carboxypeptidase